MTAAPIIICTIRPSGYGYTVPIARPTAWRVVGFANVCGLPISRLSVWTTHREWQTSVYSRVLHSSIIQDKTSGIQATSTLYSSCNSLCRPIACIRWPRVILHLALRTRNNIGRFTIESCYHGVLYTELHIIALPTAVCFLHRCCE